MNVCVYMCVCMCALCVRMCMCACVRACVCVCMCTCTYICVCAHALVYVCSRTYQGVQVLPAHQVDGTHVDVGEGATPESIIPKCVCCVTHKLLDDTNRIIYKCVNELCRGSDTSRVNENRVLRHSEKSINAHSLPR